MNINGGECAELKRVTGLKLFWHKWVSCEHTATGLSANRTHPAAAQLAKAALDYCWLMDS